MGNTSTLGESTFPLTLFITPLTTRKKKVVIPNFHNNNLTFTLNERDIDRAKKLFDNGEKCYYLFACEYVGAGQAGILLTYSNLNGIIGESDNVMAMAEMFQVKVVEL